MIFLSCVETQGSVVKCIEVFHGGMGIVRVQDISVVTQGKHLLHSDIRKHLTSDSEPVVPHEV